MREEFIHLFRTAKSYYIYDVNTDCILNIPEKIYIGLRDSKYNNDDHTYEKYIGKLKCAGFLKPNRVEEVEHPATKFLPYYFESKLSNLILQVTQRCNLRCEYCVYSGRYENRTHTKSDMDINTAKSSIDYLIAHASESDELHIGFYGGEPLLVFPFIKECVEYALVKGEGKKITFNLTTNGTLFTKEIIEFFVNIKMLLLVSLDGTEEIHDKFRRYAVSGKGSHTTIIKNLEWIKNGYPEYYKDNIQFNIVLNPDNSLEEVIQFFYKNDLFYNDQYSASIVSDRYLKDDIPENPHFNEEFEYNIFKFYLKTVGKLKETSADIFKNYLDDMKRKRPNTIRKRGSLPQKSHRGGPCIPGVMRLFVNINGEFLPCERVSEKSAVCKLGNINSGLDIEKAEIVLNVERATANQCKNCWAYTFCTTCIGDADGFENVSSEIIKAQCVHIKYRVEEMLKTYSCLREIGYEFAQDNYAIPRYIDMDF